MGGPGGRPHGPNIGVFFYLNTKLLTLLYDNRLKAYSFRVFAPLNPTRGCAPKPVIDSCSPWSAPNGKSYIRPSDPIWQVTSRGSEMCSLKAVDTF